MNDPLKLILKNWVVRVRGVVEIAKPIPTESRTCCPRASPVYNFYISMFAK